MLLFIIYDIFLKWLNFDKEWNEIENEEVEEEEREEKELEREEQKQEGEWDQQILFKKNQLLM